MIIIPSISDADYRMSPLTYWSRANPTGRVTYSDHLRTLYKSGPTTSKSGKVCT